MKTAAFSPKMIYEQICASMPKGLEKQVLEVLLSEPEGTRVPRTRLIFETFGYSVNSRTLANSKEDRQIRRAIQNLRMSGVAVLSDSGSKGYYLGGKEDREKFIAEQISRRNAISTMIKAMRRVTLDQQEVML